MDLPIDDKELEVIIESLSNVDTELTRKLKLVKEVRQHSGSWPAPYKKILREKYGMVI